MANEKELNVLRSAHLMGWHLGKPDNYRCAFCGVVEDVEAGNPVAATDMRLVAARMEGDREDNRRRLELLRQI